MQFKYFPLLHVTTLVSGILFCKDNKAQTYQQELAGLEASVKALELHVSEIASYIKKENETIPKVII